MAGRAGPSGSGQGSPSPDWETPPARSPAPGPGRPAAGPREPVLAQAERAGLSRSRRGRRFFRLFAPGRNPNPSPSLKAGAVRVSDARSYPSQISAVAHQSHPSRHKGAEAPCSTYNPIAITSRDGNRSGELALQGGQGMHWQGKPRAAGGPGDLPSRVVSSDHRARAGRLSARVQLLLAAARNPRLSALVRLIGEVYYLGETALRLESKRARTMPWPRAGAAAPPGAADTTRRTHRPSYQ